MVATTYVGSQPEVSSDEQVSVNLQEIGELGGIDRKRQR
jgi:hypothetical protein